MLHLVYHISFHIIKRNIKRVRNHFSKKKKKERVRNQRWKIDKTPSHACMRLTVWVWMSYAYIVPTQHAKARKLTFPLSIISTISTPNSTTTDIIIVPISLHHFIMCGSADAWQLTDGLITYISIMFLGKNVKYLVLCLIFINIQIYIVG